jgi:hypothetical protein
MPKLEIVKSEAVIDLKVGSKFLQELQAVLIYLTTLQSAGRIQEAVNKAKEQGEESLDEWEKSIYTMLVLITNLEENARAAGLISIEEIPEADSPLVSPE